MATHAAGTRLGPYEILSSLGAGGMGDVYKARDTRLDRIVALKISKEEFTPRFETEARATAALEHQHICRLYDVCHEAGASFLVMEYVEGKPLKGPLPLDQALTYARQIAGALDEAHRKQIVHRDLKPSNILVTSKGGVKLLDFGLAKLGRDRDAPFDDEALTRGLTAAGTILGTLHYMSPEQLQGSVADARSDIFAFGLVLYEMITGKRAFDGASAASVIAAILERPAPSVAEVAPASLDRLLQRCLAKDPEERWQSARDIKGALDLVAEPAIPSQTMAAPRKTALWPWLVAGATAVALAALAFVHFRETQPEPRIVRFQIPAPEKTRIVSAPTLSPDGRYVAFLAERMGGARQIWVHRLDTMETRFLPGTEDAIENFFWSPDSHVIAFSADRKLKAIEASGSGLRTICDVGTNIAGGSWSADGVVIYSTFVRGLFRVPAAGGTPVQIIAPRENEAMLLMPSFLPDGRHFVYLAPQRDRTIASYVATLDGSQKTRLTIDERTRPTYVAGRRGQRGRFIFTRGGALVAQAVDEATFAPVGDLEVIVDNISDPDTGAQPSPYSVSATGTLSYLEATLSQSTRLAWFDRQGAPHGFVGPEGIYNDVALSPDETRVAVTRGENGNIDIWLIDLARNVPTRFTSDPAQDWHPVWSPDGQRLAFSSTRIAGGRTNSLFWKDAGNVGSDEVLYHTGQNERLNDWSPDGKFLLINRTEGRDQLWVLPVAPDAGGSRKGAPYLQTPFVETRGQFFPVAQADGRSWIVYTSNESGDNEIYVESYPRGLQKDHISSNGGMQPRWRRDGKELFYLSPDLKLMAVDVTVGPKLTFGTPRALFQTNVSMGGTLVYRMLRYDVTRDGTRFLINTEPQSASATSAPITVVLNWSAMLKN